MAAYLAGGSEDRSSLSGRRISSSSSPAVNSERVEAATLFTLVLLRHYEDVHATYGKNYSLNASMIRALSMTSCHSNSSFDEMHEQLITWSRAVKQAFYRCNGLSESGDNEDAANDIQSLSRHHTDSLLHLAGQQKQSYALQLQSNHVISQVQSTLVLLHQSNIRLQRQMQMLDDKVSALQKQKGNIVEGSSESLVPESSPPAKKPRSHAQRGIAAYMRSNSLSDGPEEDSSLAHNESGPASSSSRVNLPSCPIPAVLKGVSIADVFINWYTQKLYINPFPQRQMVKHLEVENRSNYSRYIRLIYYMKVMLTVRCTRARPIRITATTSISDLVKYAATAVDEFLKLRTEFAAANNKHARQLHVAYAKATIETMQNIPKEFFERRDFIVDSIDELVQDSLTPPEYCLKHFHDVMKQFHH